MCLLLHYLRHAVLNSHTWNTATLTMQVLESRDFSRGTVPLQLPFGTITIWQRRMDVTATCSMTRESATYPYLHTTSKTLFCTFTPFWKGKGVEVSRGAFLRSLRRVTATWHYVVDPTAAKFTTLVNWSLRSEWWRWADFIRESKVAHLSPKIRGAADGRVKLVLRLN